MLHQLSEDRRAFLPQEQLAQMSTIESGLRESFGCESGFLGHLQKLHFSAQHSTAQHTSLPLEATRGAVCLLCHRHTLTPLVIITDVRDFV